MAIKALLLNRSMFRYRLRTLLIVLAIAPPMLWVGWSNGMLPEN